MKQEVEREPEEWQPEKAFIDLLDLNIEEEGAMNQGMWETSRN